MPPFDNETLRSLGLLYEKSYLASQLTDDPGVGQLDVQALIDGKEQVWRIIDKSKVETKKTIILSSWCFKRLDALFDDESSLSLIQFFSDLIKQDFSVYVPNQSGLIKISNKTSLINALKNLTPISTDTAIKMAAQLHWSKDYTAIFNWQRVRMLLSYLRPSDIKSSQSTYIDMRHIQDKDITQAYQSLIEPEYELHIEHGEFEQSKLLKKTKDRIYSIEFNENEEETPSYLKHDYSETPNLRAIRLSEGTIQSQELATFIAKNIRIEEISIGHNFRTPTYNATTPLVLTSNQLPHLLKLSIRIANPAEQAIFSLIEASPNLVSIDISNNRFQKAAPTLPKLAKGQLNHLTRFYWHGDGIMSEQLSIFLHAAPNLEDLDIGFSVTLGTNPLHLVPNGLPHLTKLTIRHCSINEAQLLEILIAAPNLKEMHILDSKNIGNSLAKLTPNQLSSLTRLTINYEQHFDSAKLLAIIKAAPNLEELNFDNCTLLGQPFLKLQPKDLAHVKILRTPGNITGDELTVLFKRASQLEVLVLKASNFGTNEKDDFSLEPDQLKHIQEIKAEVCFRPSQLTKLLLATPNIRLLDLGQSTMAGNAPLNLHGLQLNKLKKIIPSRSISAPHWGELLSTTSQLESIDFNHCKILGDESFQLKPNQLKFVKTLGLNLARITSMQLSEYLNAAPHIETVNLMGINVANNGDLKIEGQLNQLTNLNASGSDITTEQVLSLITAAKNLESIDLNGCKKLDWNNLIINLSQLTQLQSLTLINTEPLTTQGLACLIKGASHLEFLDISGNRLSKYQKVEFHLEELKQLSRLSHEELVAHMNELFEFKNLIKRCTSPTSKPALPLTSKKKNPDLIMPTYFEEQAAYPESQASSSFRGRLPNTGLTMGTGLTTGHQEASALDGKLKHDPSTVFEVHQLYRGHSSHPATTSYHLKSSHWTPPCTFVLHSPKPEALKPVSASIASSIAVIDKDFKEKTAYQSSNHYFGQIKLGPLVPGKCYTLPALSTHDVLKSYFISIQGAEIIRDEESGYHYLRVKEPIDSGILYCVIESQPLPKPSYGPVNPDLVEALKTLRFDSKGQLIHALDKKTDKHALIQALITFCHFPSDSSDDIQGSPVEILNHLIKIRAGACRHRAMLFVALATALGIKATLIENASHAFVNIEEDGIQHSIDLGGAEATVKEVAMKPIKDDASSITSISEDPDKTLPVSEPQHTTTADSEPSLENPFKTWNNLPLHGKDWPSIAKQMITLKPSIARHLLVVKDDQAIEALHEAMLESQQPIFFTENLDSMSLRALKASDGPYEIVDSPLASFLKKAKTHPLTWIINWSNPKAEHVGLNSIIDDLDRRLGDLPLPANLRIVVAMDNDSAALMGEDFYSRFDGISRVTHLGVASKILAEKELEIKPFDALITNPDEWKKVLLGTYEMDGQHVAFKPGALIHAISNKSKRLHIHNAPWDNPEFRWFMTELHARKRVFMNGQEYLLPDSLQIDCVKPLFNFSKALANSKTKTPPVSRLINTTTFAYLFPHHRISPTEGIKPCQGWLEKDASLNLVVTEPLSEAQWYTLWAEVKKNHSDIKVQCAPHIQVPEALKSCVQKTELIQPQPSIALAITNDLDFAIESLPKAMVIPVGPDTRFESLFYHIHRHEQTYTVKKTKLLETIEKEEPVVFKGKFTNELAKRLQTLFTNSPSLYINGEHIAVNAPITLVTSNNSLFEGIAHQDIIYDPNKDFEKLTPSLQEELKAWYNRLNILPSHSHFLDVPEEKSLHESWVKRLCQQLSLSAGELNDPIEPTSPEKVLTYLDTHPFVFLLSETGAGKSYFVERILRNYGVSNGRPISIHHGLEHLKAWARSDGEPILFLDEANLQAEHFHAFDNIAQGDRIIWIEGDAYSLSPHHKVIFAGNPKQYEGRLESDLLKRFPYYLEFKGQRLESLLIHLLDDFLDKKGLITLIETYYQKALEAGLNITPRNAQMMCLNAFILKQQPLTKDLGERFLMQYAVLNEINSLAANTLLTDELSGTELMQIDKAREGSLPPLESEDFIWTSSRKMTAISIQALLIIRERKTKGQIGQAFGINGMVLEGSPGLGKSRLLISLLEVQKVPFSIISTSTPEMMRSQLIKAFHEGQVALIDELNSFPDELLLNALLSGTDLEGNPPKIPGFCLLATQNPITYQGRQALSKALSNRLLRLNLDHYDPDELQTILEKRFKLPQEKAALLIRDYDISRKFAAEQGLFPPPNPRTLFKEAQGSTAEEANVVSLETASDLSGKTPVSEQGQNIKEQKNTPIFLLLDSYLKNRCEKIDASGKTKEYFHGSFFSFFQKSFTQKKNAVTDLKLALDGKNVDLSQHLSTLRNGKLGQELRKFIKSGMAKDLVDKEVNTVHDFIQALQDKNAKKFSPH